MILLVRPLQALAASLAVFQQAQLTEPVGGLALQEIISDDSGLQALTNLLTDNEKPPQVIIITSQYAAAMLVKAFRHSHSDHLPATLIAIGQKTRRAMEEYADFCLLPHEQSSEGVLAMPCLTDVAQKAIIIVKGQGGRKNLYQTLTQRGAWVTEQAVYQREYLPVSASMRQTINTASTIIVTNGESAKVLLQHIEAKVLPTISWIVPSQRIADLIKRHGLQSVYISAGASDAALLKCLHQIME